MVRLTWPFAIFLAVLIALVARRPRLFPYVLVALAVWFLFELRRRPRR